MAMKSLDDLFVHFLRDIYYAEKQILKALPKMARKADSDQLREAFENHLRGDRGACRQLSSRSSSCSTSARAA